MSHTTPATGRVRSRRRLDVTTVLAVALPLLTVGALAFVRPDVSTPAATPPEETALTRAVVICPTGAAEASLASSNEAAGTVDYVLGDRDGSADVTGTGVTEVTGGEGPLVARAEGELAPGLVAGRFESPLAAAECRGPAPDQWFTGLGAGARHTSVIELVNPDAGPAVVDATLYGVSGIVDAPELRGVAVPGRGVVRLPLADLVPRRDELAVHLTTSRGRVTASLRDRFQQLGTGGAAEDWLRAQDAPATSNLLLGLPTGTGQRTLVMVNPGDDETRARVRLVTDRSVFVPAGLEEEVVLAPQSVTRVSLTELMRGDAGDGALGLLVDAPEPITATVRTYADGDLSHAVPGAPFSAPTTALVPTGDKQVVLAEATKAGTVTVTSRTADGKVVGTEEIEVVSGRGYVVDVPRRAVLLTVTPRRTDVAGSVVVTGDGATVIRLREHVTSGLIGAVRPGL